MKIISISSDRKIFEEGSSVRARQVEYGALFDELHIVVFAKHVSQLPRQVQIASNVWVYATNSISRFLYMRDAVNIAQKIIAERGCTSEDTVVSTQDPFEAGLVGCTLKKKFSLPLHVQIHTDFLNPAFAKESFMQGMRVRIARRVLAQADAVRVVSAKIAESLRTISLSAGVVPTILPIFVDVTTYVNAPVSVDLKKKYPQFNFIIFMASRLTKEKNIPFAISVFKKLRDLYPRIGLVIVGDGPEKQRLMSLAHSSGLGNSVVFEDWQKDLVSYYKTANAFLLTSNYEGYGMTLVEAVASGCPVVSTDVGIASELLSSGKEPFVCPVGDMGCFFNALSRLIKSTGLRKMLINESFDRLDAVVVSDKEKYLSVYKQNIESAHRREHIDE